MKTWIMEKGELTPTELPLCYFFIFPFFPISCQHLQAGDPAKLLKIGSIHWVVVVFFKIKKFRLATEISMCKEMRWHSFLGVSVHFLFSDGKRTDLNPTSQDGTFKTCFNFDIFPRLQCNIWISCSVFLRYTNKFTLSLWAKMVPLTWSSASTLMSFPGFNATYEYFVQYFFRYTNKLTFSLWARMAPSRPVSTLMSFPGFNATYECLAEPFSDIPTNSPWVHRWRQCLQLWGLYQLWHLSQASMQHMNFLFNLFQIYQQTHLESIGKDGTFNFEVCIYFDIFPRLQCNIWKFSAYFNIPINSPWVHGRRWCHPQGLHQALFQVWPGYDYVVITR